MFVLQIPSFYNTKMLVYNFNLCSSALEMPDCVSSGTDGCCDHSIIPQQSGKSGLAFRLLTPLHLSGLAQVSAAAAAVGSFAPMTGGRGYTRVVECECGWGRVLFCPLLGKVLKEWREESPLMVLGIMVMVFGVMRGMSSGERLMASV